jgi:hypothetical protein
MSATVFAVICSCLSAAAMAVHMPVKGPHRRFAAFPMRDAATLALWRHEEAVSGMGMDGCSADHKQWNVPRQRAIKQILRTADVAPQCHQ